MPSTGTGFGAPQNWAAYDGILAWAQFWVRDMNGDGDPDPDWEGEGDPDEGDGEPLCGDGDALCGDGEPDGGGEPLCGGGDPVGGRGGGGLDELDWLNSRMASSTATIAMSSISSHDTKTERRPARS